jgi:hypothetical protein
MNDLQNKMVDTIHHLGATLVVTCRRTPLN